MRAEAPDPRRLLLVELLHDEICHRDWSMHFPFVKGLAEQHGIETRWLIVATEVSRRPGRNRMGRELRSLVDYRVSASDHAQLAALLESFAPSHVLTAGGEDPAWRRLLDATPASLLHVPTWLHPAMALPARSDTEVLVAGTPIAWNRGRDVNARAPAAMSLVGPWLAWLGVAAGPGIDAEGFLVDQATPDYTVSHLDGRARQMDWALTLVSGTHCFHNQPAVSPLLQGEPFSGCTFCRGDQAWVSAARRDPLLLLREQMRRYLAARGPSDGDERVFDVYDARVFARVEALADIARELGVRDTTFAFSIRLDELLRHVDRLERALPVFAGQGCLVRLDPVGIENLSEAENERFNKRVSPTQVRAGLATLRRLEQAHPTSFQGLMGAEQPGRGEAGSILFTPWTTLADIALNLERGEKLGFPADGRWLVTLVLLYPGLAMTRMAELAGDILSERFEDPAPELSLLIPLHPELVLPWRFLHEDVARYYRLIVRLWAAHIVARQGTDPAGARAAELFAEDEVYAAALALYRRQHHPLTPPLEIAKELLAVLQGEDVPATDEGLLAAIFAATRPPLRP